MDGTVQLSMNTRILLLVCLVCMAAVPVITASDNYMGGNIVIGGSGPNTIRITEVTTAVPQGTTATTAPPAVAATGSLAVTSSPAGAVIVIDGVQQGVSPSTIPGLSPGSHTLLVKLDGYQDVTLPVTITAGQTQSYSAALSPVAAAPVVTPSPPQKKTPGFGALLGLAALGAVFLIRKNPR
jgi:hypothetical protein